MIQTIMGTSGKVLDPLAFMWPSSKWTSLLAQPNYLQEIFAPFESLPSLRWNLCLHLSKKSSP